MKVTLITLAVIIGLITLGVGSKVAGLEWYKWFQPQVEDAKRNVFTHTRAYVESRKQDLVNYRLQIIRSKDPVEVEAIKMTIRHQFAEINPSLLGHELEGFLRGVLYEQ